jgi:hypothetical protein
LITARLLKATILRCVIMACLQGAKQLLSFDDEIVALRNDSTGFCVFPFGPFGRLPKLKGPA